MIKYNEEYNEELIKICSENPTSYYNVLRGKEKHYLLEYINECTKDILNWKTDAVSTKIACILNKMQKNLIAELENKGAKGTYIKIIDGTLLQLK